MDPYTWFLIIAAVVGAFAANDAASRQTAAINRNAALKENDRRRQEDELQRQATAQMNEAARQSQADSALFDVIAGEYGGGKTVDRAKAVGEVQYGEHLATLQSNAKAGLSQLGFDARANQAQADSQLAAIDRPSLVGTALQIGGAYYAGQQKKPAAKPAAAG